MANKKTKGSNKNYKTLTHSKWTNIAEELILKNQLSSHQAYKITYYKTSHLTPWS